MLLSIWRSVGLIASYALYPLMALLLNRTSRTRVILKSDGKILLVKNWLGRNYWELPGGGISRSETPAAGAIREVREELGLVLEPSELISLGEREFKSGLVKFPMHYFLVDLDEVPKIKLQKFEIVGAEWFAEEDFGELQMHSPTRDILREN